MPNLRLIRRLPSDWADGAVESACNHPVSGITTTLRTSTIRAFCSFWSAMLTQPLRYRTLPRLLAGKRQ
jgi:hypothetical protein